MSIRPSRSARLVGLAAGLAAISAVASAAAGDARITPRRAGAVVDVWREVNSIEQGILSVGAFAANLLWTPVAPIPTTSTTTTTTAPPKGTVSPPPASTPWKLAFSDNFSGSSLNASVWGTCYPWFNAQKGCSNLGNDELEWFMPSQVQVSGNALHLVASETPSVGVSSSGSPKTYPWTSGMVTSYNGFDFTYGYVQVVARAPAGDGLWSALWLLPQNKSWPPEIDIMEIWGNYPNMLETADHVSLPGPPASLYYAPTNLVGSFHTYAVDWEPGTMTWYLDGRQVYQLTGESPNTAMYIIADLAVDGTRGTDSSTPTTTSLDIQSVQVWQH
jgi:beta-glucanase (GH16 family)